MQLEKENYLAKQEPRPVSVPIDTVEFNADKICANGSLDPREFCELLQRTDTELGPLLARMPAPATFDPETFAAVRQRSLSLLLAGEGVGGHALTKLLSVCPNTRDFFEDYIDRHVELVEKGLELQIRPLFRTRSTVSHFLFTLC